VADDISAAKRQLRREMLELRRAITDRPIVGDRTIGVRDRLIEALAERFDGVPGAAVSREHVVRTELRRVLAYDAVAGEVDLGPLLDALRASGVEVVVPAATPDASVPVLPSWPQVIIVPGVAFDGDGARLGRGGGWYDRLLGDPARQGVALGVAFETQVVDSVPTEPHDAVLDAVVTDRAVRWVGNGR